METRQLSILDDDSLHGSTVAALPSRRTHPRPIVDKHGRIRSRGIHEVSAHHRRLLLSVLGHLDKVRQTQRSGVAGTSKWA